MTATVTWWTRRAAGAALAVALAAVLTGGWVRSGITTNDNTATGVSAVAAPSVTPGAAAGVRVVLRVGDRAATATLADIPQARQFAAMLPLTVRLTDAWGQAKSGRLPRPLPVEAAATVYDPARGEVYLWPPTAAIAVYYDDLGQTVPDPSLVRLGVIDSGLDHLAEAGSGFAVRIELAAATGA
ncbi:MAG TPA: cyclophilin-like fold protein [Candidatus Limnocylindrales bacterium]